MTKELDEFWKNVEALIKLVCTLGGIVRLNVGFCTKFRVPGLFQISMEIVAEWDRLRDGGIIRTRWNPVIVTSAAAVKSKATPSKLIQGDVTFEKIGPDKVPLYTYIFGKAKAGQEWCNTCRL